MTVCLKSGNQLQTKDVIQKGSLENVSLGLILFPWLEYSNFVITAASVNKVDGPDGTLVISQVSENTVEYTRPSTGKKYPIGTVIEYMASGGTLGNEYKVTFVATLSNGDLVEAVQCILIVN